MCVVAAVAGMIAKLYRKASANMAFVRTGMGGASVIQDGGTIIIPVVHQVIPVSLETMRLNVERRGPHALITKDNLRVDLSAEFYIKVQANAEDILQAARSLGDRNVQADAVSELVQEKLVSALRTVAATKELVELHAKRDEFASAVQEIVTNDLASNGLTLESVTISALDQTDPTQLQERNVFDAQGLRKIAEITQRAKVERNEIEQETQQQVVAKNVVDAQEGAGHGARPGRVRGRAADEGGQRAGGPRARGGGVQAPAGRGDRPPRHREDEADRDGRGRADAGRRAGAGGQAGGADRQAARAGDGEIQKKQAVEVAERAKEVAVAEKERERAAAQAEVLTAEAEREEAKQKVITVQVTAEAEREAEKKLIAAKQAINESKIREETNADVHGLHARSSRPRPSARRPTCSTRPSCGSPRATRRARSSGPRANGRSRWST